MRPLQSFIPDSLAQKHIPDSLNAVQSEIVQVAEKIASTPMQVLISELVDKAIAFGLKVLVAILIYIAGAWLIRRIKKLIDKVFIRRNTDATIVSFVQSLVSIALTIILILTTVGALGIDTTSLAALLTGGGLAIGMALNGTVQNFAGGIMLLVFRPFKAGDYIETQGYAGVVSEVTIVSTKLLTVDNKTVIIPNGILSNGTVNNFSLKEFRRLDLLVDVEYGTDCAHTKEVLTNLLNEDERILSTAQGAPADIFVALSELRDSSIQFVIKAWVKTENYWDVKYSVTERIYTELPKNNIEFPYPKLDVNLFKKN